MIFQENETVEFKEIVVDDIKKEIIAFANCNGGKLYIGVQDDGTVIGLENPDKTALQISNMVRDAIKPDITMFLHYETLLENGKYIVAVDVQRGTERPYYIAKKGLRPEGVYVRQGYFSVPATDAAIRRMIKETDGDHFESMRCMNQELTFEAAKKEFAHQNMKLEAVQMQTLKLMDHDGIYSNLACLLSDQCVHTIKVAVFQGTDQTIFKNRREFSGSLMKQLNDVYDFIDFHNQTHATIDKLYRIDRRDYPEIAVREALLNLIVHRDYAFRASALISIYDDRIEFVSVGGLVPGIELEDIMFGLSVCRNQNLANIFYRLQLIEAYGTGMKKILNAYKYTQKKPLIETTKNAFKITLPNINFIFAEGNAKVSDSISAYSTEEKLILKYLHEHGEITRSDAESLLKVSASTASRVLRKMVKKNLLFPVGRARGTRYVLSK